MPDILDRLEAAVADRTALQRELGRGAVATVHLAEDRTSTTARSPSTS